MQVWIKKKLMLCLNWNYIISWEQVFKDVIKFKFNLWLEFFFLQWGGSNKEGRERGGGIWW